MAVESTTAHTSFDLARIRGEFPALHQEVHGKPLVYLDNAATSQKPLAVIERIDAYYRKENSNVHRGVHYLSQRATDAYEQARKLVQGFIHAEHEHEVIFTRGTTESINLLASSFGQAFVREGDEILISAMEHHSNIVPWQLLCERSGAKLKVVPVDQRGELDMEAYAGMLNERTRLVAIVHISNTLGTINPVEKLIQLAHAQDIPVMLDGAQAVPHQAVDVQALDVDFYVFSGHKMFGPTGIGVLYGKEKWLEAMPPYMGGGDMIKVVRFEKTTFNDLPHKFEAGTPNIAGVIGLGAAVAYLNQLDFTEISRHEHKLLQYGTEKLQETGDIRLIGTASRKASVISFLINGVHPYDAGTILDQLGVAIRTGHHCTQPLMEAYGIPGTMRASFAFYNTTEEIDRLTDAIRTARKMFGA